MYYNRGLRESIGVGWGGQEFKIYQFLLIRYKINFYWAVLKENKCFQTGSGIIRNLSFFMTILFY